jgi:APA family basic amino acid/polyamine antiporter
VAWIIGWDLIIEYGFSVATIAVGWGGYLKDLLDSLFGLSLPDSITQPPGDGGTVNLFAAGLVIAVMFLLMAGVRESARANTLLVLTKLLVLLFFVVIGFTHFTGSHFTPFSPHGTSGTVDAAALIFFAYIGFDAVSTSGEEAKNPQRDLPLGIIGSLAIVTVVYILVAVAAIGLVPSHTLAGSDAPLTDAIRQGAGLGDWAGDILSFGALVAITSVVITIFYGQTRIFFAMCRDGLVPAGRAISKLSARKVPVRITAGFGIVIAILAMLIPLSQLAELVNIGTLFAFLLVNIGVIVLRRTEPDMERPFRVPLVPLFPLIGAALCVYLMTRLQAATWWRFGIWLVIGLAIYGFYGRHHSRVQREGVEASPAP